MNIFPNRCHHCYTQMRENNGKIEINIYKYYILVWLDHCLCYFSVQFVKEIDKHPNLDSTDRFQLKQSYTKKRKGE